MQTTTLPGGRPAISRSFASLLLGGALLFSQLAGAAEDALAESAKPFASVWRIRGEVSARDALGKLRALAEGSPVYVGERVRAAPAGEAVLKARDAGLLAVRPGAEFLAERFAANGKASDHQILRLLSGSLRIITGWIGHLNRVDHRVLTPSATIGIRGTDHEPYVLPAEQASSVYRQGTYDKVNRGATALEANGRSLLIDPGRVGFVRDPAAVAPADRALLTILLPVLLARVPEFYVPGSFDAELDAYSANAEAISQQALAELSQPPAPPPALDCQPVAEAWLARFDHAIGRRDAAAIVALFAPELVARATVRNADGSTTTVRFNRSELADSTLAALDGLSNYVQRRISLETAAGRDDATCQRVGVTSVVVEQGSQAGQPYRFEAVEEYLLELRDGHWLATRADTTQR